jgi:ATP-binding cassette subfamily B multidrug efflux pump
VWVIQSLGRERANIREFGEANQKNLNANLKATWFSEALFPSVEAVNAIGLALVVFFGGSTVLNGSIEVGVLVAFALYLQRFSSRWSALRGTSARSRKRRCRPPGYSRYWTSSLR